MGKKNDELKSFIRERDHILERLKRIKLFADSFNVEADDIESLEVRLSVASKTFDDFFTVQEQVEDRTPLDILSEQTTKRIEFEDLYYEVTVKLKKFIANYHKNSSNDQTQNNPNRLHSNKINLPTIQLPEFSGAFSDWLPFRDTYLSVIHNNGALNDIEKLHYLRSSLKGEALRAIESVTVSSANYATAWSLLEKRYENTRLIVNAHVRNILNITPISKANAESLRKLIDTVTNNIESLKVFKIPVDSWDAFLVPVISDKLDFQTNKEWQFKLTQEIPKFTELLEFLESRCQHLKSLNCDNNNTNKSTYQSVHHQKQNLPSTSKYPNKNTMTTATHIASTGATKIFCPLCKRSNHLIHNCTKFLKLTIHERLKEINKLNLCNNCLKAGHNAENCNSNNTCKHCQLKHNSLLHLDATPMFSNSNHCTTHNEVLLSTAIIYISDIYGNFHKCRALLDAGSQSHFISKELCSKLKLPIKRAQYQITGINMVTSNISDLVTVTIKSRVSDYSTAVDCLVSTNITRNLPLVSFPKEALDIPRNTLLADEDYNVSNKIDILLGSQIFLELLKTGKIQLKPHKVYLHNSVFGWLLGGEINFNNTSAILNCNLAITPPDDGAINQQICKFWELEDSLNLPDIYDPNGQSYQQVVDPCEKHFTETHFRTNTGRFVVSLPARNNVINLGNSFEMAKGRFASLKRKFRKDEQLYENYKNFMTEYKSLGHMERVPDSQIDKPNVYYIPHHAVYKDSKIRVVFDASAKTTNGLSLNHNLLSGPVIQQDLFSIITRFRSFNIVLKADICKMYRQILINPDQADYQRIIWSDNLDGPLEIYRLLTVTYGVTSSPFLAIRCLQELAYQFQNKFPEACKIILRDCFVDDIITGCNDKSEAFLLREQLIALLKEGGFELAKWASNQTDILVDLQNSDNSSNQVCFDKNAETKTLGIFWNCEDDSLYYKVEKIEISTKLTKRNILSLICKVFDPLGLVSPIIIRAKIIMQQLWKLQIGWDELVPIEIKDAWFQLVHDLENLNNVKIRRRVINDNTTKIHLIGFADASEKAYGAVLYVKCTTQNNEIQTNLLVSKSRVAPLKPVTIPRLELLAALLLAKLTNRILKSFECVNFEKIYLYTDSTIVLAWLAKPASNWKPFVANRVAQIQSLTEKAVWQHVGSTDNPADLISRGSQTHVLLTKGLWWYGPQNLNTENLDEVKDYPEINNIVDVPEKRKITVSNKVVTKNCEIFNKFSEFSKLKKCIAWIFRFINNCKSKNTTKNKNSFLSPEELNAAHTKIIKIVQKESFTNELNELSTGKTLSSTNRLIGLSPFLDRDNVIRVGGRLGHAKLAYDRKHPIMLPKSHHVSKLIIRQFHVANLHSGAQATLAAIRQAYWIIAGRSAVRAVLHKCMTCFKTKPIVLQQKMGNLPSQRLEPARPFVKSGIDYCGPIMIKEGLGRGKKTVKSYICLFICLCTKAIHLELVCDLTTEGFLNALRRFMSRRGIINEIHSDNATNFTGSERQLKELSDLFRNETNKNKIINSLSDQNVKWCFIPPRTPNFGGLWESNVKSVKFHLKRVIGETLLIYEEMYTLLTRIEACLNSRPLIPLSNDPNDLNALTPGHFLVGEPLTATPEPNLMDLKMNRLSRFQLIERLRQHFWQRWQKEYLNQLQTRSKWKIPSERRLEVGDLVLLVEDGIAPLQWPMGRVQRVHPGKDGLVRVVDVKTNKGIFKRGITKVCALPCE